MNRYLLRSYNNQPGLNVGEIYAKDGLAEEEGDAGIPLPC